MTSLHECVEELGGSVGCAKLLGVAPATVRNWLRLNPRGFLKYAPELGPKVDPARLCYAVVEHENRMRA
jgi:hypothetical protein